MISFLRGKIIYIGLNWLILDVNDVGYKIHINSKSQMLNSKQIQNPNNQNNKTKIGNWKLEIGNSVELYIYHHIREDRSELYGFEIMEELQIFELLLTVNGVGPKMAMNIIGKAGINDLKNAISKGDGVFFTTIPGVGKKLAGKIVLELKNKLGSDDIDISKISPELSTEILEAMASLGYKKSEIYPYLAKIPSDIESPDDKIRWVLKEMNRK